MDGEMLSVGRGCVVEWEVELEGCCVQMVLYRSGCQLQLTMVAPRMTIVQR